MNYKNILLLSNNNDLHTQIDNINQDKNNIIHMYNSEDMYKFYKLFKDNIDIVILDENTPNIDMVKDIKEEKTTIYIQPPIKDELIENILNNKNLSTIEKNEYIKIYLVNINKEMNSKRYTLIRDNLKDLLKGEKTCSDLIKLVDLYYLDSEQTRVHIKSLLRYSESFLNYFNNQLKNELKEYIELKQNKELDLKKITDEEIDKKLDIFINSIKIFYPNKKIDREKIKKLNLNEIDDYFSKDEKIVLLGAFFHDIGKNFITKDILDSIHSLNKDEIEQMKLHTLYGVQFMKMFNKTLNKEEEASYNYILKVMKDHHNINDKEYFEEMIRFIDNYEALIGHRSYAPIFNFKDINHYIRKELKEVNGNMNNYYSNYYITMKSFFVETYNMNHHIFKQSFLDNFESNKDYFNKYLNREYYYFENREDRKNNERMLFSSFYNIIDNLSQFDNKYSKEVEYIKEKINKFLIKKEITRYGVYDRTDVTLNTNLLIDLKRDKIPNLLKVLDVDIFEQWGLIDKDLLIEKNHQFKLFVNLFKHIKLNYLNKKKTFAFKDFIKYINKDENKKLWTANDIQDFIYNYPNGKNKIIINNFSKIFTIDLTTKEKEDYYKIIDLNLNLQTLTEGNIETILNKTDLSLEDIKNLQNKKGFSTSQLAKINNNLMNEYFIMTINNYYNEFLKNYPNNLDNVKYSIDINKEQLSNPIFLKKYLLKNKNPKFDIFLKDYLEINFSIYKIINIKNIKSILKNSILKKVNLKINNLDNLNLREIKKELPNTKLNFSSQIKKEINIYLSFINKDKLNLKEQKQLFFNIKTLIDEDENENTGIDIKMKINKKLKKIEENLKKISDIS